MKHGRTVLMSLLCGFAPAQSEPEDESKKGRGTEESSAPQGGRDDWVLIWIHGFHFDQNDTGWLYHMTKNELTNAVLLNGYDSCTFVNSIW